MTTTANEIEIVIDRIDGRDEDQDSIGTLRQLLSEAVGLLTQLVEEKRQQLSGEGSVADQLALKDRLIRDLIDMLEQLLASLELEDPELQESIADVQHKLSNVKEQVL